MGRPKRYASEAEKMKAYRERKKLTAVPVLAEPEDTSGFEPAISSSGQARESTVERPKTINSGTYPVRHAVNSRDSGDSRGGSQLTYDRGKTVSWSEADGIVTLVACPDQIETKEWRYAFERAERAKRYALAMPGFVKPSEVKYQDPLWQWENEVRGRFGGIIGGSLSGSRGPHAGN